MLKPFLLVLIAISFSVTGELLLKSGMNQIGVFSFSNLFPTLGRILTHPKILGGFLFFALGAFWWLAAISRVNLSWAYPMLAIGYILILLFSAVILKEHVNPIRWFGAVVICLGIYLVFRS
jgi:multidrug transporter EmrE-like cation transporter